MSSYIEFKNLVSLANQKKEKFYYTIKNGVITFIASTLFLESVGY